MTNRVKFITVAVVVLVIVAVFVFHHRHRQHVKKTSDKCEKNPCQTGARECKTIVKSCNHQCKCKCPQPVKCCQKEYMTVLGEGEVSNPDAPFPVLEVAWDATKVNEFTKDAWAPVLSTFDSTSIVGWTTPKDGTYLLNYSVGYAGNVGGIGIVFVDGSPLIRSASVSLIFNPDLFTVLQAQKTFLIKLFAGQVISVLFIPFSELDLVPVITSLTMELVDCKLEAVDSQADLITGFTLTLGPSAMELGNDSSAAIAGATPSQKQQAQAWIQSRLATLPKLKL